MVINHPYYLAIRPSFVYLLSLLKEKCRSNHCSLEMLHLHLFVSWSVVVVVQFWNLQILLNCSLQCVGIGTDHLSDLLAILEQQERRHGADPQLLSNIGCLVDVDLVEFGVFVFFRELGDYGCDRLARPTPGREAVEDD